MKRNHIIRFGWLTGLFISCFSNANAQEIVPCLVFTGNSDTPNCIDLSKFNRITFGDEEMRISSSKEGDEPEVTLLYSLFNHLEIGDAVPTDISAVKFIEAEGNAQLRYIAGRKSLVLDSSSDKPYSLGIFSLTGSLIATSKMSAGQSLPIEALSEGTYIVVATNGESRLTLKIILN